jgi:uncharacterized protein
MWLNLLLILGTVLAGVAFGFFVYWIIIKIQDANRTNRTSSAARNKPASSSIAKEIDNPPPERDVNESEEASYFNSETSAGQDDDWLNTRVAETSTSDIKKADDDWLNAEVTEATVPSVKKEDDGNWLNSGVEEVPANVLKQRDDAWLNAGTDQSPEPIEDLEFTPAPTSSRDFQINRNGSLININVTATQKKHLKKEKTVVCLRINVSRPGSARKGGWPYELEVTGGGLSPSLQSLQDFVTVKPLEEPVSQSYRLMDEISIRPVEYESSINHPLMDEITVKPVEGTVSGTTRLIDEVAVGPVEESLTESHGLLDEISIKETPGPVHIDYEILDNLITKTIYQKRKAQPTDDKAVTIPPGKPVDKTIPADEAIVIQPAETPGAKPPASLPGKAEPGGAFNPKEFAEFLNQKGDLRQTALASAQARARKSPELSLTVPAALPLPFALQLRLALWSLVYLVAMVAAEFITNNLTSFGGLVSFFAILLSLTIISLVTKDKAQCRFWLVMGIVPLIRIIILIIPTTEIPKMFWQVLVAIPILFCVFSLVRNFKIGFSDLGFNKREPLTQILVSVWGFAIAYFDFLLLKPGALQDHFSINAVLFFALILMAFTGFLEEIAFRGIIQRESRVLGSWGWIYVALLYTTTQIGYGNFMHLLIVLAVSLLFGWVVKKTGSLWGVSLAHGLFNIGLFLVFPGLFII